MFNPLSIKKGDKIEINLTIYRCINIQNFKDARKSIATRYELYSQDISKTIWLEVKKDRALNYQLFYYEKVQKIDNNPSFFSLIGSQTLGYHNPKKNFIEPKIYNRVHKKGEHIMPIKHIVLEEELPQNPEDHGYFQDGNKNWYFMTKRSAGTVKEFQNRKIRSWEYKNKINRLLIEIDENEYQKNNTNIVIYEGRLLSRRDLKRI